MAVEPSKASLFYGINEGIHAQEGIGDGIYPGVLDPSIIDRVILVNDDEAIECARDLSRKEAFSVAYRAAPNCLVPFKWLENWVPGIGWSRFRMAVRSILARRCVANR